jgi:hypothetical protein
MKFDIPGFLLEGRELIMNLKFRKARILVIEVARFYAMALLFYGHYIERIMLLKKLRIS